LVVTRPCGMKTRFCQQHNAKYLDGTNVLPEGTTLVAVQSCALKPVAPGIENI